MTIATAMMIASVTLTQFGDLKDNDTVVKEVNDSQYLRTDLWTITYAPHVESETETGVVTTNCNGKTITAKVVTEASHGYARIEPYCISPFSSRVTLAGLTVLDGPAAVTEEDPLVLRGTQAEAAMVTVRATSTELAERTLTFSLSGAKRNETIGRREYTGDAEALSGVRKAVNDDWYGAVVSLGVGDKILDKTHDAPTYVYTGAYFRDASGNTVDSLFAFAPFLRCNVYRDNGRCLRGMAKGQNTGAGGSFVLGKRLIGNASHWFGGVRKGRKCYVQTSEGLKTLTMTGTQIDNLGEWALREYGADGFVAAFGFPHSRLMDVRVIEVAEDIPDECMPNLLPYGEAVKVFEKQSATSSYLDLSCGAWVVGQNNAIYPTWAKTEQHYGSANICEWNSTTVRADCLRAYNGGDGWWNTRDYESGRPSYVKTANNWFMLGAYHTLAGGPSYVAAADVLAEVERRWGRNPDETLKRITANDL